VANQVKESSIDYAYETIDAVVEAMDKVTAQPELAIQFVAEFLQNAGDYRCFDGDYDAGAQASYC